MLYDIEEGEEEEGERERLSLGLYVVGTPIGNLVDISERALEVLERVDSIYCEDKRTTVKLLREYGLEKVPLVSFHKFSSPSKARAIVDAVLQEEKAVALVSDAGTPLVSDPGHILVASAHEAGVPVFVIPGASAVVAALSGAGFNADRFIFEGFLPKGEKRKKLLQDLAALDRTVVFFESPHRIVDTLNDCISVYGPSHNGAIARELTKKYEQMVRAPLSELLELANSQRRGEFTVVLEARSGSQKVVHEQEGPLVDDEDENEIPVNVTDTGKKHRSHRYKAR